MKVIANVRNEGGVLSSMLLPHPNMRNDIFTDMLANPKYVIEHMNEFTNPTHSTVIEVM